MAYNNTFCVFKIVSFLFVSIPFGCWKEGIEIFAVKKFSKTSNAKFVILDFSLFIIQENSEININ